MQQNKSRLHIFLIILFSFSGFASMIYQLVWFKQIAYVSGVTAYAFATVVASFMIGLALGSFIFGKAVDKYGGRLIYSLLEFGIAAYALLFPLILGVSSGLYSSWFAGLDFFYKSLGWMLFGILILIIPTIFMGGTLPAMAKLVSFNKTDSDKKISAVYAWNTYGAGTGAIITVFWLIPQIGLSKTIFVAASINFIIACVSFIILKRIDLPVNKNILSRYTVSVSKKSNLISKKNITLLALFFFTTGFISLSYELLWTRLLTPLIGQTVFAYAIILAIFLYGIFAGSLYYSFNENKKFVPTLLLKIELIMILGALLTVVLFNSRGIFLGKLPFLLSGLIVFVPTFVMGFRYPLFIKIMMQQRKVGDATGIAGFYSSIGGALGILISAFWLINAFGIQTTILLLIILNVLLCFFLMMVFKINKKWLMVALLILTIFLVSFHTSIFQKVYQPSNSTILYYKEGLQGSVLVSDFDGEKSMFINSKNLASNRTDYQVLLKMLAHLPILASEHKDSVLVVGLGSGISASAASKYDDINVIVVEISPEIIDASDSFRFENHNIKKNPKVEIIFDDARNYVLTHPEQKYDAIIADPVDPLLDGGGVLYTQEYFMLLNRSLNEGGVVSQWISLSGNNDDYNRQIIKTFLSVFSHATAWSTQTDMILLGSNSEIDISKANYDSAILNNQIAIDLNEYSFNQGYETFKRFEVFNESFLREYSNGSSINTDDLPRLSYFISHENKTVPHNSTSFLASELVSRLPENIINEVPKFKKISVSNYSSD